MYAGDLQNLPLDYDALIAQYHSDGDVNNRESWVNQDCLAVAGGIVSATGYGDGSYPVYVARDHHGDPAVIEVRFLEEDDEEEEAQRWR